MTWLQSGDDDDDSSSDASDSADSDDECSSSSEDGDSSGSQSEWWRCCCLARGPAATCCLRRGTQSHMGPHWRQQRRITALKKNARTWRTLVSIWNSDPCKVPAWGPFDASLVTAFLCRFWTKKFGRTWPKGLNSVFSFSQAMGVTGCQALKPAFRTKAI